MRHLYDRRFDARTSAGFAVVDELAPNTPKTTLSHPMPIAITFFAGQGEEPTLIKIGTAYEAATHHRTPPPAFGPVSSRGGTTGHLR